MVFLVVFCGCVFGCGIGAMAHDDNKMEVDKEKELLNYDGTRKALVPQEIFSILEKKRNKINELILYLNNNENKEEKDEFCNKLKDLYGIYGELRDNSGNLIKFANGRKIMFKIVPQFAAVSSVLGGIFGPPNKHDYYVYSDFRKWRKGFNPKPPITWRNGVDPTPTPPPMTSDSESSE